MHDALTHVNEMHDVLFIVSVSIYIYIYVPRKLNRGYQMKYDDITNTDIPVMPSINHIEKNIYGSISNTTMELNEKKKTNQKREKL